MKPYPMQSLPGACGARALLCKRGQSARAFGLDALALAAGLKKSAALAAALAMGAMWLPPAYAAQPAQSVASELAGQAGEPGGQAGRAPGGQAQPQTSRGASGQAQPQAGRDASGQAAQQPAGQAPAAAAPVNPPAAASPAAAEPAAGEAVGMPNPVVAYRTMEEAKDALGFAPLYLTRLSGYRCSDILVIGGKLAELRYARQWEPDRTVSVRTYLRQPEEPLEDISGIYGIEWHTESIDGTTVYVARPDGTSYAASWAVGPYTFSVRGEKFSYQPFRILLEDGLLEMSRQYYGAGGGAGQ